MEGWSSPTICTSCYGEIKRATFRWFKTKQKNKTMFYKTQYGLVAVSIPSYFERPTKITRHMHSLSFRQVHVSADYYMYSFFPMTVFLWNRLPTDLEKGKQKSPGRATRRSRSQPLTPGGREKVTQINVYIANKQMRDKHKDQKS